MGLALTAGPWVKAVAEGIFLGDVAQHMYGEKLLLPLGMQKTWSGFRNLKRVSRELLFVARVRVFGWIRFRLVVKEQLWCTGLRNATEHLGLVYL